MNQFNCYRIFLTALSPAHIGTGDTYQPTNYVIEDGALYEFDTGSVTEALSANDRAELVRITEGRPGAGMIQAMQRFFFERRSRLIPSAVNRILVSNGVTRLYTDRIGKIAQREARGRQIVNVLEIGRTAYNPISRQPILVGSSLKGAIRTALLDQVNNGRPTTETEGLHRFQGKGDLFRYNQRTLVFERDPMRLIQVSDASWRGDLKLPKGEVFFAVNLKKAPVTDREGQSRPTRAESGPPQILECIPYLQHRAFEAQLNIQLVDGVNKPAALPETDLRFDTHRIASACNAFYRPILEQEIRSLSTAGYLDIAWLEGIRKLLNHSRLNNGKAFLLRVGRHSGAESVTLRGVRKIRIMKGRGQSAQEAASATTVWLAARERGQTTGLLPFGWTLAECYPLEGEAADENISLKSLCEESQRALGVRLELQERQAPRGRTEANPLDREPGASRQPETKASTPQASSPTFTTTEEVWDKAMITWNPGSREVTAVANQQRAYARGKAAEDFLKTLTEQQRKQLQERRRELTNVRAVVEISGNQKTLKRLERG